MRGSTPRKRQKHLKIGEKRPKHTPKFFIYVYISMDAHWRAPDATWTRRNAAGASLGEKHAR